MLSNHQKSELVKIGFPFLPLLALAALMTFQLATGVTVVSPRDLLAVLFGYLLFFPAILLGLAVVSYYVVTGWQMAQWLEMARDIGFEPAEELGRFPGCPPLERTTGDPVEVTTEPYWGAYCHSTVRTTVEPEAVSTLRVYEDGLFQRHGNVSTGDEAFDDRYAVRTDDPTMAELLTTDVREALLAVQTIGSLTVEDGTVYVRFPGRTYDPGKMQRYVDVVEGVARNVEGRDR